jgi:hypothetical protein
MSKNDRLILGMLLGGILVFISMTVISLYGQVKRQKKLKAQQEFPSSLDALTAAPGYHRLIFEDEKTRVIELILSPGQETPLHNHHGNSKAWVTKGTPVVFTEFGKDRQNNWVPIKYDTVSLRADQLNKVRPEQVNSPFRIKNIGSEEFHQYRIEYKE